MPGRRRSNNSSFFLTSVAYYVAFVGAFLEHESEWEERWKGIIKAHLCVGQFVITVVVGLRF